MSLICPLLCWLCLWVAQPAAAHPFSSKTISHRLDVAVQEDQLRVYYTVDVPTVLMGRNPDPQMLTSMGEDLQNGLALQVDESGARFTPMEPPTIVQDGDTHRFTLSLAAPILYTPHKIRLSNGNMPDITAVHSAVVSSQGWVVERNSLWRVHNQKLVRDDSDRWSFDPTRRTLDIDVRPPSLLEYPWMPAEEVPASEAQAPSAQQVYGPAALFTGGLILFGWVGYRARRSAKAVATRSASSTSD